MEIIAFSPNRREVWALHILASHISYILTVLYPIPTLHHLTIHQWCGCIVLLKHQSKWEKEKQKNIHPLLGLTYSLIFLPTASLSSHVRMRNHPPLPLVHALSSLLFIRLRHAAKSGDASRPGGRSRQECSASQSPAGTSVLYPSWKSTVVRWLLLGQQSARSK